MPFMRCFTRHPHADADALLRPVPRRASLDLSSLDVATPPVLPMRESIRPELVHSEPYRPLTRDDSVPWRSRRTRPLPTRAPPREHSHDHVVVRGPAEPTSVTYLVRGPSEPNSMPSLSVTRSRARHFVDRDAGSMSALCGAGAGVSAKVRRTDTKRPSDIALGCTSRLRRAFVKSPWWKAVALVSRRKRKDARSAPTPPCTATEPQEEEGLAAAEIVTVTAETLESLPTPPRTPSEADSMSQTGSAIVDFAPLRESVSSCCTAPEDDDDDEDGPGQLFDGRPGTKLLVLPMEMRDDSDAPSEAAQSAASDTESTEVTAANVDSVEFEQASDNEQHDASPLSAVRLKLNQRFEDRMEPFEMPDCDYDCDCESAVRSVNTDIDVDKTHASDLPFASDSVVITRVESYQSEVCNPDGPADGDSYPLIAPPFPGSFSISSKGNSSQMLPRAKSTMRSPGERTSSVRSSNGAKLST